MKIIIFGNGKFASLAYYCLTHDSAYEVAAFTVDNGYEGNGSLHDLPVVSFDDVASIFPPSEFKMIVPLGYLDHNRLRESRYKQAKNKGYEFISYISSKASVWPDLKVGKNCMIYEHAIIQPFAEIGNNTIIRSGCHISHHCMIGDSCFLSAHVVLGGSAIIEANSFVGLNATIRDNITIAEGSIIGAGALVVKDTKAYTTYIGVPAKELKRKI